jgi:beta-glucanase (GH16 family)
MVTSFKGFRFKYGFVQVTARLPFRTGLWPALWLAAANEKWPPEIDILEHWGARPVSELYLHPLRGPRRGTAYLTRTADTGWHTWRLMWIKSSLTWYYDNKQTYKTTTNVPAQAMYFIASLADTSNPVADTKSPAGPCNGTLLVKSVKVWQP